MTAEAESPAVSDKDSGFAGLQLARDLWIVIMMIVILEEYCDNWLSGS